MKKASVSTIPTLDTNQKTL